MGHFRSTIKGNRGEASRLGTIKSGMQVSCNGWNSGIRISAFVDSEGKDTFKVYKTSGSNKSEPEECVLIHKDK